MPINALMILDGVASTPSGNLASCAATRAAATRLVNTGTVPGHFKLRGLTTKYIFRKALEGILPKEIIWRGKQGYSLPVKNLLRNQFKDYMTTLLHESPLIREDFELAFVDQLIAEHLNMQHNHNHVLWGLMNIAIWHRRFFPNG